MLIRTLIHVLRFTTQSQLMLYVMGRSRLSGKGIRVFQVVILHVSHNSILPLCLLLMVLFINCVFWTCCFLCIPFIITTYFSRCSQFFKLLYDFNRWLLFKLTLLGSRSLWVGVLFLLIMCELLNKLSCFKRFRNCSKSNSSKEVAIGTSISDGC